jgi:anaerobic carbon-monoxide dehydrogenase iron sulfur subunit
MKKMIVDYKKCLACKACETACAVEHHPSRNLFGALGDTKTQINVRVLGVEHEAFPHSCRHCDPADCLAACLSGAITRDQESGAILLNQDLCKPCARCAKVCPFDVIAFKETHRSRHGRKLAYKCDLCNDRIKAGGEPACVEACQSGALVYGDFDGIRSDQTASGMKCYLPGEHEAMPPLVELFIDLRRKKCERRSLAH